MSLALVQRESRVADLDPTGWRVLLALGDTEFRRLVTHPVFIGGLVLMTVVATIERETGPRAAYSVVTSGATFFLGPFVFFAANLLASRERRDDAEEWLSSLPVPRHGRTAAALFATLAPAVITALLTVLVYGAFAYTGLLARNPHPLELATPPLAILGAGALGVMVARWAPWPGAAALVMVALVAVHVSFPERLALLGAYVEFAAWGEAFEDWAGVIDGSRVWHAVYLLALCAMAATGALLVDARRKALVLAVGAAFTALAGLAGWAQLP